MTISSLLSDILRCRLHRIVGLYSSVKDTISFSSINHQSRNMILPLPCPRDNFITVSVHNYKHLQRVFTMVKLENVDMRMMTVYMNTEIGTDSMYFTTTMKVISSCRNIRSLQFGFYDRVSDTLLFLTGHHCHDLIQINLGHCSEITDIGVMYLISECPKLIRVDLSYTKITDDSIIQLTTCCHKLRSLNLEGCIDLTPKSMMVL